MVGVGKFDILTQNLKIHFHIDNFYTYICKEFLNTYFFNYLIGLQFFIIP